MSRGLATTGWGAVALSGAAVGPGGASGVVGVGAVGVGAVGAGVVGAGAVGAGVPGVRVPVTRSVVVIVVS